MRRYGLGSWHQEPGQKGMTVRVTEYISETDYKSIVDACDRYSALSERIAFSVVSRNRDHLLDLRDLFANLDRFGGALRYVNQRALPVTFMNELLNWLVSTRFYLETERSFATTNYGIASEQLLKHVHATNDAFDQFPGYRFMYKLRDYAQHGGVPLSGLTVQRSPSGATELVPHVLRQTLLASSFNWGGPVRAFITESDDAIPVLPLVDEATQGLELIERVAFPMHLGRVTEVLPTLISALTRADNTEGHPAAFSIPDGDGQTIWSTLPTSESLMSVRDTAALPELPDRAPLLRPVECLTAPQRDAARRASAAIGALLLPDSAEHQQIVDGILLADHGATPLISGLSNMARVLLIVASQALGTSAEVMLGALTPGDDEPIPRSP